MAVNIEGESYKHKYYSSMDPHLDPNGSGTSYDGKKTTDGQIGNGFMTKEANDYLEYDKEMIKHTILGHEALFRQQVYEMHRVYKIQRTLMKPYENQEIHAYSALEDARHTCSPARASPDGAKMIEQMHMPLSSTTHQKATTSVNHDINYSSKFLREGSVQSSPNGFPSIDFALHTKQGSFDLQLPANYSVDGDNASDNKPTDFFAVPSDTKHQNFVDFTLAKEERLQRFADNISTSIFPTGNNLVRQHIADLNEPSSGMYMSRTNGSISSGPSYTLENDNASDNKPIDFLGVSLDTKHQNFGDFTLVSSEGLGKFNDNSSISGLTTKNTIGRPHVADLNEPNFVMYMGRAIGPASRGPSRTLEKSRHQSVLSPTTANLMFNKEYSNSKRTDEGTNSDLFYASSRIRWDEKPLINKGKQVSNLNFSAPRYSGIDPIKTSKASDGRCDTNNKLIYQYPDSSAGWFSKNPLEASVINKFAGLNHAHHSSPSTPVGRISSPHTDRDSVASTIKHSAQQYHGDPGFASGKGTKNFNLNEAMSDGQEDILVEQHGVYVGRLEHSKGEGSVSGIHSSKKESACTGLTVFEETRKVSEHSFGTVFERSETDRMDTTLTRCDLSDSAITSVGCGISKDKASDGITTRAELECNKNPGSSAYLPPPCQKIVARHGQTAEGVINKCGTPMRNFIDLNEDAPNEDDSESSVVSHECHVATSQNNTAKRTSVIDLEVPACEDFAAFTSYQVSLCGEPDVFNEDDLAAAKNILALSMDVRATGDTPDDILQWFAEIAVSSTDVRAGQVEVQRCINSCGDDDCDSFELLTLKLEETQFAECSSKPQAQGIPNDAQSVSTANLLTKPRRGQQRKRRQKRDFQKDILPSISSLSRPEIIDDIQLLEGLVQTSGGSWVSSMTKRQRNGGRTRGRKPKKQLPVIVEEEVQIRSPWKLNSAGLEAQDRGIVTWGRTTRRCRRPRCAPGNTITAAS